MTSLMNRRLMLAQSSVALAASALPATALTVGTPLHPDAELLATVEKLLVMTARIAEAHEVAGIAHDLAETLTPPWPETARVRATDQSLYNLPVANDPRNPGFYTVYNMRELERFYGRRPYKMPLEQFVRQRPDVDIDLFIVIKPNETDVTLHRAWPEAQARADEIIAALEEWKVARDQAFAISGYTAAEQKAEELYEQKAVLSQTIIVTPASTLVGLMAKALVLKSFYGDDEFDFGETTDMRLVVSLLNDMLEGSITA